MHTRGRFNADEQRIMAGGLICELLRLGNNQGIRNESLYSNGADVESSIMDKEEDCPTHRHASWERSSVDCRRLWVGGSGVCPNQSKLCIGAIDARFHGGSLPSTAIISLKFSYRAKPREFDSATCHKGAHGAHRGWRTPHRAPGPARQQPQQQQRRRQQRQHGAEGAAPCARGG